MPRIMVTGGAGMIGSNLVRELIAQGHEVIVVDNLWRGNLENLKDDNGKYVIDIAKNFFAVDLSYQGSLDFLQKKVDYVIHLADIVAGIGYVFNNQSFIFRQNVLINTNVINAMKGSGVKGFINVGTACSFPEFKQNTFDAYKLVEKDLYPAQPESAYGWSKLMGQYETGLLEKEFNVPTVSLMLHNVYGAPCDFTPERSQVIPSLIRKAVKYPDEDFIVWGSGRQGRAFLHVDDVVRGIMLSLEYGLGKGTIQLGPSECTSIKTVAETVVKISKKDITIVYDTTKPEGDKSRAADFSNAKKLLGWEPEISLVEGLSKTYQWIESRLTGKGSI